MLLLLEVNTSGEPAKGGFQPDEIEPLLPELATFKHVEIRGLMCMAALWKAVRMLPVAISPLCGNLRDRLAGELSAGNCVERTFDGHERRL